MRIDTAGNIINDAMLELGLIAAALANPYTSTDPNVVGMRAHLKALGRSLTRKYAWSHLQLTHSLETEVARETYALPADYARMVYETQWDQTAARPLSGPLSPQGWQLLTCSNAGAPVGYSFRVQQNAFYLHPVPTTVETLSYEYVSAYWVRASGQPVPLSETPTASTDTLFFDGHLLSRGLKWKFRESKRLDATAEKNDFEEALAEAMGNDGAAPVIDLAAAARGPRLPRLPETGWGS